MSSYSAITFRSQLSDKHLDEEFLTLLYPMIQKSDKYIIGIDDKDKLSQHYHICFEYNGGKSPTDKLKQKFKTKGWKSWFDKVNSTTQTKVNASGDSPGLCIKTVEKDESNHNLMIWIGYCVKDYLKPGYKGFDDEYITTCIKYFNLNKRIKANKDPKLGWRYLTKNTAHTMIENWCKEKSIDLYEPNLFNLMTDDGISSCHLSAHTRALIHAELIRKNLYDHKKDYPNSTESQSFLVKYSSDVIEYNTETPDNFIASEVYRKMEYFESKLQEHNIVY